MLMGADVVIATPGRMISHLQNSGVDLSHVKYLILDEADRMLDMGFFEDIARRSWAACLQSVETLLFGDPASEDPRAGPADPPRPG